MKALFLLTALVAAAYGTYNFCPPIVDTSYKLRELREEKQVLQREIIRAQRDFFHVSEPPYDTFKYMLSKENVHSVEKAVEICEFFGGYLADIEDESEHTFVREWIDVIIDPDEGFDTGPIRLNGTFVRESKLWSLHGVPENSIYEFWAEGFPVDPEHRSCLMMTHDKDGFHLRNTHCEGPSLRFLCEIPVY